MMPFSLKGSNHTKDSRRAIVCMDVDCFEEQVWRKHRYNHFPDNTPIVIVNADDVVVSFNYSARASKYEISRGMNKAKLAELQLEHPELMVLSTGFRYGRSDTFTPLKESDLIISAVCEVVTKYNGVVVERASCDEVFLDVTKALLDGSWNSDKWASKDQLWSAKKHYPYCKEHDGRPKSILYEEAAMTGQDIRNRTGSVEDSSEEALIIRAGIFSEMLLHEIHEKTGYNCSAGVGPSKLIAKVATELNRPAGVAMMTTSGFMRQTSSLPYDKLPGLKRKSGDQMRVFYEEKMRRPLEFIDQIRDLSTDQLCEFYRSKGEQDSTKPKKLYDNARGIDWDPVKPKLYYDSMGLTYTFWGTHRAHEQDVKDLASDMAERLEYMKEYQEGRLPEHLLLRIEYKTKDSASAIKERWYFNPEKQTLDPGDLEKFIHHARIKNDIDLEIVKAFQFRAMHCKPLK